MPHDDGQTSVTIAWAVTNPKKNSDPDPNPNEVSCRISDPDPIIHKNLYIFNMLKIMIFGTFVLITVLLTTFRLVFELNISYLNK